MVNLKRALTVKFWSSMTTSSILLGLYSANLVRVYRGSKHKFVKKLIVLLMLYNVGVVTHQGLLGFIEKYGSNLSKIQVLGTLTAEVPAIILEYSCFNVSHWIFAFKYYQIARETSFTH